MWVCISMVSRLTWSLGSWNITRTILQRSQNLLFQAKTLPKRCLGDVGLHQYGLKIDLVTRLLEYYKKNPSKVQKPPLSSTDIAKEVLNIVMFNVFKTVDPTSMINPDKLIRIFQFGMKAEQSCGFYLLHCIVISYRLNVVTEFLSDHDNVH